MTRHLALYDLHIPRNIDITEVISYIRWYKPTHCILGGDFLDMTWASHWNTPQFSDIGWERVNKFMSQEFAEGKRILGLIASALPADCQRWFLTGNHEAFLIHCAHNYPGKMNGVYLDSIAPCMNYKEDLTIRQNRGLARMITRLLDLKKFSFECLPHNKPLNIGHIVYLHGHQFKSEAGMKRQFPARNVVAGHLHTHFVSTLHNSGQLNRAHQYVLVPCLCDPAPGYLETGATRWMHGFWVADVLPSGLFDGRVVKVLNGKIPSRPC